jgi:hypothetical protein
MLSFSCNCTKFSEKFNTVADIYQAKDILDEEYTQK